MSKRISPPPSIGRTLGRWRRIVAALRPFAWRHKGWLVRGGLAALLVIGARLALPWPIHAVLKPWLHGGGAGPAKAQATALVSWLPQGWGVDPALVMGGAFLILLLVLGLADLLERVCFAQFSIAMTRDLRAAAFQAAMQANTGARSRKPGDLVARLVGDAARIKGGLKGFLVHVATNGAMFAGVTAVLFWMDWGLGLIFAVAGIMTVAVMAASAKTIFENSRKFRKKEGKRADAIQRAIRSGPAESDFARVKSSKGRHNAKVTRIQGLATWVTHGIFGVAVLLSFWVGTKAVAAGRLQVDHLVVFMMYALMMRGPIVRLARQGARTGKILAGTDRLVALLGANVETSKRRNVEIDKSKSQQVNKSTSQQVNTDSPCVDLLTVDMLTCGPIDLCLRDRIQLAQVRVKGAKSHGKSSRLGPLDLDLRVGERIALLGGPGSGKTTLLEILAGRLAPRKGAVLWDNVLLSLLPATELARQIAYVPQQPAWVRRSIDEYLNLPAAVDQWPALTDCGVDEILARLPLGIQSRLSSDDLSPGECKALCLARALGQVGASVWLLDDPLSAMSAAVLQRALDAILQASRGNLLVMAMSQPVQIERFDRVVELDAGELVFDGSSADWLSAVRKAGVHVSRKLGGEEDSNNPLSGRS